LGQGGGFIVRELLEKKKPIRILHVDDEGSHLEFTKIFLEEVDEEVVVDSASTPEEAFELQEKNCYDCIVSDYKMLSMDGIELAQKVREKSDVPFILYTGQGSEEVAQYAFKAGIDDYLKKESEPSHYQILAKRVRQNVEKFRAEQLYRKVVDDSRDGIIILNGMDVVFMNRAAAELFGHHTSDDLIGSNILDLLVETEQKLEEYMNEATVTGTSSHLFEVKYRTSSGAIRVAEVSFSIINYMGQSSRLCFLRDITDRKRMEARLTVLHQQASQLARMKTVEAIAETTLEIMQTVFKYQLISFHIVEDGVLKTVGIRGSPPLNLELPLDGKGITVKAAREKRSVLVNDTRGDEDFIKGSMESMSELAVPVILNGETISVLNVESQELNDFSEDDKKLLETLRDHVAFALNRIRNIDGSISGEALRAMKMEYALGRLEEAEKLTSLVRGQLRDSLRNIKNASDILIDQPDMLPELVASIGIGMENASRVAEIISDTLETSRRDDNYVEINEIVKTVVESIFIPRTINTKLSLMDGLLVSEVDRSKILRVVENLVRNSVEAMSDGGTLEIRITEAQQKARIQIRDTGKGIPSEALDRLFELFNSTKEGHVGIGLAFCKSTLNSMGGSIEVGDTGKSGTTMVVTVPLKKV